MAKANEEKLLDMVSKFDDDDGTDYGDNTGPEDDELDGDDEEDAGEEDDSGDEDQSGDDESDDSGDDDGSSDNAGDQRRTANEATTDIKGLRPVPGGFLQDVKGNLFDARGNLLARAGSERRLFERSQRQGSVLAEQKTQLENLTRENNAFKQVLDQPLKLGITAEDLQVGYPIIADFKRDPIAATRKMLELTMSMGHDLKAILGDGATGSVEMSAIQRMLDERLKPLQEVQQQREQNAQQQREQRETEAAIARFVEEHEHASVHLDAIDSLIGKNPGMSPERAYFEIRRFADQRGLDFSKPLGPQVQASASNNRQQRTTRQQPRNIPLPNGRQRASVRTMEQGESASATSSWDGIISRALREAQG